MTPLVNTPEQFAARLRDDTKRYGEVIKAGGITAN